MQHFKSAVVICAATLAFAACNKDLTRDEAKRLILAQSQYPKAVSDAVFNGRKWGCAVNDSRVVQKELVTAGILIVAPTGRQEGPMMGYDCADEIWREFQVSLTPASAVWRTGPTEEGPALRECELDFGEITGVETEDHAAVATFTTRYVRPTPFAKFGRHHERCLSAEAINHTALFAKFDDGWRLSTIR